MSIKIAVIGAGSSYTPEVIEGLLNVQGLFDVQVALYDLPEGAERVSIIGALAKRMINAKGTSMTITYPLDLEEALDGCSFVISQFRVGLLNARIKDELVPLEYGLIGQETTGAGGFYNAMRTIPHALSLARMMDKVCADAWMVNFTNPSGIITEAVQRFSRAKCVGLCNVPYNMRVDAARILNAPLEQVECQMVGLNHLSFVTDVKLNSQSVIRKMIDSGSIDLHTVKNIPKVQGVGGLIKTLDMIPSPYLQYYYYEGEMLKKAKAEATSAQGTRGQQVQAMQEKLFEVYKEHTLHEKPEELNKRGGAYYSTVASILIKALAGYGETNMPINSANDSAIDGLETYAVIEANAIIKKDSVKMIKFGELPLKIRGLIQQVKAYESLIVEAAVERSRKKAILALLNNPLVHGYENAVKVADHIKDLI